MHTGSSPLFSSHTATVPTPMTTVAAAERAPVGPDRDVLVDAVAERRRRRRWAGSRRSPGGSRRSLARRGDRLAVAFPATVGHQRRLTGTIAHSVPGPSLDGDRGVRIVEGLADRGEAVVASGEHRRDRGDPGDERADRIDRLTPARQASGTSGPALVVTASSRRPWSTASRWWAATVVALAGSPRSRSDRTNAVAAPAAPSAAGHEHRSRLPSSPPDDGTRTSSPAPGSRSAHASVSHRRPRTTRRR